MRIARWFALLSSALVLSAQAQRLIVNGDEWTLWDTGASAAGSASFNQMAANLKTYLDSPAKPGCSFLDMGSVAVTQAAFSAQMAASPACTYTRNSAAPFTLANLQNYDAVFLGGSISGVTTGAGVAAVLVPYIAAGGNVYVAGGTGAWGDPTSEANYWNPTLNALGLSMATVWSPVTAPVTAPVTSSHPLLAGVTQLYFNNANPVSAPVAAFGAQVVVSGSNAGAGSAVGLIAVYDRALDERANPRAIPAVGMWQLALLGILIGAFGLRRARRTFA